MGGNINSEVTSFVYDKITSYDELNAPDRDEGDKVFAKILEKNLPQLNDLKEFKVAREGALAKLYLYEKDGRKFLVKKLDFENSREHRNSDRDEVFIKMQVEYKRAENYYEPYMPNTVFVKRYNEKTGETEFLVIQDLVEGEQYKGDIKDKYGSSSADIKGKEELVEPLKVQLEDIMNRSWQMYTDTGWSLDFDFMMDKVNNKIWIIDTDFQQDNDLFVLDAWYLQKLYGITLTRSLDRIVEKDFRSKERSQNSSN